MASGSRSAGNGARIPRHYFRQRNKESVPLQRIHFLKPSPPTPPAFFNPPTLSEILSDKPRVMQPRRRIVIKPQDFRGLGMRAGLDFKGLFSPRKRPWQKCLVIEPRRIT